MPKKGGKDVKGQWDTAKMLDHAIQHYGLEAQNDGQTGESTRNAWMRTILYRLKRVEGVTKRDRRYYLPEQNAKRFIETDMLDYFENYATREDVVTNAHRLAQAKDEDEMYAELMAREMQARDEQAEEASEEEFPPPDFSKMRHLELQLMLQVLISEVTGGKQRFDVGGFEADYIELSDLRSVNHYELEPENKVRKQQLADRMADPAGSYLVPIEEGNENAL